MYEITQKENSVQIFPVTDLNLEQTLFCGQCFRWKNLGNNTFCGVVKNSSVTICLENSVLSITPCAENGFEQLWRQYFDLDLDYAKIRKQLGDIHPTLKKAAGFSPGIRILRQDPWEALCTFIISQNNNIPRITGIIERLCENFGTRIENSDFYMFPTVQQLAGKTPEDLAPLRSGFRAKYILDAVEKINSGKLILEDIKNLPLEQAKEQLMTIKGVGTKVADCALLFGFHRLSCFPMDVWMNRAMEQLFPGVAPADFGEYAGIAQQYIFHYSRSNPQLFS